MKYYKYLYTSESIRNPGKVKTRLRLHKGTPGYFILYFANGNDQLEIMNTVYLKLNYYRKHPPIVVGLAKSYDEAVEIVIKIVNEALKKTGNANIKEYLIKKAKTSNFTEGD